MDKHSSEPDVTPNNKQLVETSKTSIPINGNLVVNFFDDKQLVAAENFLKRIIATEKGGIKSVNEGLAVMMRAQDLGLPFSTCIEHVNVINGKTGIDVHIMRSLLSKAGIIWTCTKDYIPLYEYTDGSNIYCEDKLPEYCIKCRNKKEANEKTESDKDNDSVYVYPVSYYADFNGNIYKDYQLDGRFQKAVNKQEAANIAKSGKCPIYRIANQPVDYYAEYEFVRYKLINGREVIQKAIGHFSYSEAQAADLLGKDTYKKYPRVMVKNRAFAFGAREIADDLLMGCMETTELKAVNGVPLSDDDYIEIEEVQ